MAAFADVEWVVSAYVLCFASLLLPAGSLADRFGRRKVVAFQTRPARVRSPAVFAAKERSAS
jgi:MFS family permease